jgi:NTP pyrophosphatase (non-canonical NTP hydrolase)
MDLNDYQNKVMETAIFPDIGPYGAAYPFIGMAGELGEVCEKYKKFMRDGGDPLIFEQTIKKEFGDLLWYVAAACHCIGISLQEVAEINIAKLKSRQERGVLQGSGDNR